MEFKELEKVKNNGVLAIILFGSCVYGRQHKHSDIDIWIVAPEGIDILEIDLPEKYDVHIFEKLPLFLKAEVLKNGKILYVRDKREFYYYIRKWKKLLRTKSLKNKIMEILRDNEKGGLR